MTRVVILIILHVSNRVFLTGKVHVDYRRSLNGLFTRKALGYVPSLPSYPSRT